MRGAQSQRVTLFRVDQEFVVLYLSRPLNTVSRPINRTLCRARLMAQWQRIAQLKRLPRLRQKLTTWRQSGFLKRFLSFGLVGMLLSAAIASCFRSSATNGNTELTVVSVAVTRAAYENIIPKFTKKWKQEKSQNVTSIRSYGSSGTQTH